MGTQRIASKSFARIDTGWTEPARANLSTRLSPLAGKPAPDHLLVDVPQLITAYYSHRPDPAMSGQRVAFGTSGHRGSAFEHSFNEAHVLAITQAICAYRKHKGIDGPLFLGFDTHPLSAPAFASALEVLAANGVEVVTANSEEYTPTPAISHAILVHNRGSKSTGLAGVDWSERCGYRRRTLWRQRSRQRESQALRLYDRECR